MLHELQWLFVQVLLLSKCVVIAVLGDDNLWPTSKYNIGLTYLFLPTVTGIATCTIQYFAASEVIGGKHADRPERPFSKQRETTVSEVCP